MSCSARLFKFGAEPKLQLARGLLGEGHAGNTIDRRLSGCDHRDHPLHQFTRLARACRSLRFEKVLEKGSVACRLQSPYPETSSTYSSTTASSADRRQSAHEKVIADWAAFRIEC
jgi:hypothetical protein